MISEPVGPSRSGFATTLAVVPFIHTSANSCSQAHDNTSALHVEYAERSRKYGIPFICSLLCEYTNLEYVRVLVIYRVNQAEYVIHMHVAASQEYVNTHLTRRTPAAWPLFTLVLLFTGA